MEAVFAQNIEGTLAEPVVVRDTATGGRLAIFYQLINDDAPRGEVISEFILRWLPTVAGGTAEPGNGDVTPPDTPGEFVLMGTDPDEDILGVLADIYQVFASSDASQVKFKATTYRKWGEYADFYVNIDVDQNPNTGDPSDGADYLVYVSRRGGNILGGLWFYDPSQGDYVDANAWIDVLFNPNSDVFQVYVDRSDLGDPDAIDFNVWLMEGDLLDIAPDEGYYTYELDGTGPVTPPGQGIVIDFEDGSLSDWQVVDEADLNPSNLGTTPSSWQIRDSRMGLDGKVLYQGSNTYGDSAGTCAIGTFIIYKAQQFTNFILEVDVVTTDNDGMGLVWAYTGTDRHYRGFMLNDTAWPTNPADGKRGPFAKVEKRISDSTPFYEHLSSTSGQTVYPVGQKHHWRLKVENGVHTFSIDGGSWQLYPEDHSYKSGYVGLVLAAQEGVEFDNFTITPLDGGTTPPEDITPPVITSGPLVSNVTSSSALVSWSTDELSDSVVQYGKTSSYGLTATGADNVREHSVLLTSLSPDTTYYYRAGSTDSSGNSVWSIQRTFKTSAQGVIPSITASPSSVKPGEDISVSYSNAPGNTYDWIGMYRSGTSNQEWLDWEYLYGKKSGTITFKAPAEAGNYEFRMFENDKHDPSIATSNTVVVSSGDSGGVVTSGRVAYWPLDSNVNDAVGNHNGTVAGGATFVNDASRGMVFKVDGVSGHAVVPHASDISFSDSDSFTLSLWVKVLKLFNRWTAVVYKSREAGPWYGLWIDNGNRWAFGSSFGNNLPGSVVETNVWHHIALVQQGKNSGNKRIIYLNGNVDAQGTAANSDGTGKLFMGGSAPNTWYDYLDGLIDDVTIYNRALTSEEVKAIASGGGGGTTPPPTGKKLTIPEVAAEPGESVTVPIDIDDASGLAGADITVTYNSSILTVDQVKSTTLSAGMNLVSNTNTPGRIILRMAGSAIVSGSGALVDMIFTVSSSISEDTETPVSFESAEAYDANGQNIPVSTQNGKVKIASPRKKGDVNNDGKINAADAILALRISAGLRTATPEEFWAADINDDGKVKSNDAIIILREATKPSAPGKEFIVSGGRNTSVALGEAHGVAGESITVPLRVDDPDILAGGDISIAYDSSVLRAVSVSSESDMLMAFNLAEPGLVHIAFANSGGLDDDAIASLEFGIIADDVSPLAFRDVELYGGDALPIDVRKIDGQFASWAIPPEHSALLQNFPNPFNPETWIPYQLREDSEVTIRIYDATGGLVRGLELGHKSAGLYVSRDRAAYWDGRNETGEAVASGVYFYAIQAGEFAATRKMIVAR